MTSRRNTAWWSVRVELLGGGTAGELWPRPGRVFAVSPGHTFHTFAKAIDDAFARWDRSHLHEFILPDGRRVTEFRYVEDIDPDRELDADVVTVGAVLHRGTEFGYTFDLGDNWRHHCVIGPDEIDPAGQLGAVPNGPLPYWGWGSIPDPYGRLFDGDDGETPVPDPPHEPWPWADVPAPTVLTQSFPGLYTRTTILGRDSDE